MKARFGSACPSCRQRVNAGDEILHLPGTGWVCAPCAQTPAADDAPPSKWANFTASEYQAAIRDALTRERVNIVVEAVAGSGKTSTLEWLFATAPRQAVRGAIFLAFNRSIANELRARLPSGVECSTLNGAGHRVVSAASTVKLEVDANKVQKIVRQMFPSRGPAAANLSPEMIERNRAMHAPLAKLVALVKGTLTDATDHAELLQLLDRYSVEVNGAQDHLDTLLDAVPNVLDADIAGFRAGVIDYDDQVWLPARLNLPSRTYPLVCVDEAQDLNKAQHALVQRLAGRAGRIVAVGDPNQACYGFRGADTDSIENLTSQLRASERGARVMPLSVCYRCPSSVIELAQEIVPTIEAAPNAPVGEVLYADEDAFLASIANGSGDLIVCRLNAPLVPALFSLLKRGVRARIQGRDLGQNLIALIERVNPEGNADLAALYSAIDTYADGESAKLLAAGRDQQATDLRDRCDALIELGDGLTTVDELIDRIGELFTDNPEAGSVLLSTVHRAKGLQARRVAILRPDVLGSTRRARQEWERRQERNLKYIAVTRAQETLVFLQRDLGGSPSGERVTNEPTRQESARVDEPRRESVRVEEARREPREPAPIVEASALPVLPAQGDGLFDLPSIEDWRAIEAAYNAAGARASLRQLPRWRQWAFVVEANGRAVRCSTTVNVGAASARDCGANAIDVVRFNVDTDRPTSATKRVLRTTGWQGRVAQHVNAMLTS